ncbi:MAG: indole-3-glycerol phosphate synthase TrpC [Bacteroidales bacterium]
MNKLEEIIAHKREEVKENKELYPVKLLEKSPYYQTDTVSLRKYVLREDLSGVIAEFKRKSPSRGMINEYADPGITPLEYMQAGASALSVVTDQKFFAGSNKDLSTARRYNYCPILRKDFIVDEYQIIEARSIGADAILLITEVLKESELQSLWQAAKNLGLEVLFEVHHKESIDKLPADARLVGINNRNLENFQVNIEHGMNMVGQLPDDVVKIAESGIDSAETALKLRHAGFNGFLMGERFMRETNPGKACKLFIRRLMKG